MTSVGTAVPGGATGTGARRGIGGARGALLLAVLAAVVVIYLTSRATPTQPFSIDSTAPTGYRAIALLLEAQGAEVFTAQPSELGPPTAPADVLVVPRPARLTDAQQEALEEHARTGSTVVLGGRPVVELDEFGFVGDFLATDRELADTEAQPVGTGQCDIDVLDDLGSIDVAFTAPIPVLDEERSCFADPDGAFVTERSVGEGRVVTLAHPVQWTNARLQPAKESGGDPLDNAATALRLTGAATGVRIAFVTPSPGDGVPVTGTRDPLELLPLPVKLALVQAAAALALYLWWRGRRLGRPVAEPLPVEIAASDLVVAVGDLLRRRGSAPRAAAAMRAETRRALATRLGVPLDAPPHALVERLAALGARPPAELTAVLADPGGGAGGRPVDSTDALIQLAHDLDSIRQEVLDDHPVR